MNFAKHLLMMFFYDNCYHGGAEDDDDGANSVRGAINPELEYRIIRG